jgi:hypothetical protein
MNDSDKNSILLAQSVEHHRLIMHLDELLIDCWEGNYGSVSEAFTEALQEELDRSKEALAKYDELLS